MENGNAISWSILPNNSFWINGAFGFYYTNNEKIFMLDCPLRKYEAIPRFLPLFLPLNAGHRQLTSPRNTPTIRPQNHHQWIHVHSIHAHLEIKSTTKQNGCVLYHGDQPRQTLTKESTKGVRRSAKQSSLSTPFSGKVSTPAKDNLPEGLPLIRAGVQEILRKIESAKR